MNRIHKKSLAMFMVLICTSFTGVFAAKQEPANLPLERYAIYVASSTGGEGTEKLRYAGSDAHNVAATMNEIGGIKEGNSSILIDPYKYDIDKALKSIAKRIAGKKSESRRTEFIFYYSGHSDEVSLMLGSERYPYTELKTALGKVGADVQVVMLDSCYSGNFVRVKGGSRERPFLLDDSSVLKGHAYLSSSSESEASQEADSIQASYFTHALVTGMRGAADTSGDGKVSLNELYQYAFNETLARTEYSKAGPQHPSYNITLVGSGDLVLTDVSSADSALVFDKSLEGKFFVRNSAGYLVAEINKIYGTDVSLALPAGNYLVSLTTEDTTVQTNVAIQKGQRVYLDRDGMVKTARTDSVSRGGTNPLQDYADTEQIREEPYSVFSIGLWPGFAFNIPASSEGANISLNLFASANKNIKGIQSSLFYNHVKENMYGIQNTAGLNNVRGDVVGLQNAAIMNISGGTLSGLQTAGIMNTATGNILGLQTAGIANILHGDMSGLQTAGILNISTGTIQGIQTGGILNISSGTIKGVQAAGILNIAKRVDGVQLGLINVASEVNGASIGLLNFIAGGIMSPAVYADSGKNLFVQYQGGTNLFYTVFYAGFPWDFSFKHLITGIGMGFRLQAGFLSLDIDASAKTFYKFSDSVEIINSRNEFNTGWWSTSPSFRATLNLSLAKHFSIFGGATLDMELYGRMPDFARSPWAFGSNPVVMHPSFFAGIKL